MDFWRDFIVILNSDKKFKTNLLNYYHLFSFAERTAIDDQPPGEKNNNLLLYLLKMKTKYSNDDRNNLNKFLEDYNRSFHVLNKQWNELSKSFNTLLN